MMLFAALVLTAAQVAVTPVAPAGGDPHLQLVRWDENQVVSLVGHLGFQTMIRFAEDERIENVAIGDATAWQVAPNKRADLLFVKPTGRAPATNMVVVTNLRTYAFALSVAPAKASAATAIWTLQFVLPVKRPTALAVTQPLASAPARRNADYSLAGVEALFPEGVWDDGHQTYFSWPAEASLPAIFAINPDGSEALVNFAVANGVVVVQQTAGRFVLRRGEAAATVTSTPGASRRQSLAKGPKP